MGLSVLVNVLQYAGHIHVEKPDGAVYLLHHTYQLKPSLTVRLVLYFTRTNCGYILSQLRKSCNTYSLELVNNKRAGPWCSTKNTRLSLRKHTQGTHPAPAKNKIYTKRIDIKCQTHHPLGCNAMRWMDQWPTLNINFTFQLVSALRHVRLEMQFCTSSTHLLLPTTQGKTCCGWLQKMYQFWGFAYPLLLRQLVTICSWSIAQFLWGCGLISTYIQRFKAVLPFLLTFVAPSCGEKIDVLSRVHVPRTIPTTLLRIV